MAEGITGLNPEEAKEKILNTYDAAISAYHEFMFGFSNFMFDAQKLWYSPKAVEFGSKYSDLAVEIGTDFNRVLGAIIKNSVAAYNALSSSNGGGTIGDDFVNDNISSCNNGLDYTYDIAQWKEVSDSGDVGMNTSQITLRETVMFDRFSKFVVGLDELPLDIAFYDPNGELQSKFKQLIQKFKEEFQIKIGDFKTALDNALVSEIDNIMIAKDQAVEELNA